MADPARHNHELGRNHRRWCAHICFRRPREPSFRLLVGASSGVDVPRYRGSPVPVLRSLGVPRAFDGDRLPRTDFQSSVSPLRGLGEYHGADLDGAIVSYLDVGSSWTTFPAELLLDSVSSYLQLGDQADDPSCANDKLEERPGQSRRGPHCRRVGTGGRGHILWRTDRAGCGDGD